jgi:hypothetical protein
MMVLGDAQVVRAVPQTIVVAGAVEQAQEKLDEEVKPLRLIPSLATAAVIPAVFAAAALLCAAN